MRLILIITIVAGSLAGCASAARLDDAKCQSYGAQPGDPAYVACRSQLDAARTQARATILWSTP